MVCRCERVVLLQTVRAYYITLMAHYFAQDCELELIQTGFILTIYIQTQYLFSGGLLLGNAPTSHSFRGAGPLQKAPSPPTAAHQLHAAKMPMYDSKQGSSWDVYTWRKHEIVGELEHAAHQMEHKLFLLERRAARFFFKTFIELSVKLLGQENKPDTVV